MFGSFGPPEIILIMIVALVFFGAGRLPEMGTALGKGIKNFKKGISSVTDDIEADESSKKSEKIEDKKEGGK